MTNYIVSGWIRSGTSMMMRALKEGGMDVAYSEERERFASSRFDSDGYVGNAGGYFETKIGPLTEEVLSKMDGKVFKFLRNGVTKLPVTGSKHKVIFMRRDFEEIRQSAQALLRDGARNMSANDLKRNILQIVEAMEAREDVDFLQVEYRKVIENPLKEMTRIAEAGWPIDPEAAAGIVDNNLYRFRIENLEIGA